MYTVHRIQRAPLHRSPLVVGCSSRFFVFFFAIRGPGTYKWSRLHRINNELSVQDLR